MEAITGAAYSMISLRRVKKQRRGALNVIRAVLKFLCAASGTRKRKMSFLVRGLAGPARCVLLSSNETRVGFTELVEVWV